MPDDASSNKTENAPTPTAIREHKFLGINQNYWLAAGVLTAIALAGGVAIKVFRNNNHNGNGNGNSTGELSPDQQMWIQQMQLWQQAQLQHQQQRRYNVSGAEPYRPRHLYTQDSQRVYEPVTNPGAGIIDYANRQPSNNRPAPAYSSNAENMIMRDRLNTIPIRDTTNFYQRQQYTANPPPQQQQQQQYEVGDTTEQIPPANRINEIQTQQAPPPPSAAADDGDYEAELPPFDAADYGYEQ